MTRILLNTKRTWLMLVVLLGVSFQNAFAQVNTYLFTTTTGNTYTPITGGTVLGTPTNDDTSFGGGTGTAFPIGFPFTYNGIVCNNFAVQSNGFITVGATATVSIGSSYTAISNASTFAPTNNAIVGYNADLQGTAGTGELSYLTSGSPGSRELVVQWKNYGHYNGFAGPVGNLNFQIVLRETGNAVLINYGSFSGLDAENPQVGLRGSSNTNFNNRTTTTDWANTTAGTTNTAGCISNATIFPATGTTFRWGLTPACTGAAFTTTLLPSGVAGATYNETIVATGGVTPYTFSIVSGSLPAGLSIDATTGVISGSPTTANITPPIFTVGISDGAACPSSRDYSIVVTGLPCIPISITPTTLPNAIIGTLYAPIFFVASGIPPTVSYNYSVVAGTLPSGMTLTAAGTNAGRLTGTPSNRPASSLITIRARVTSGAYAGCFGTIVIDLQVNCPPITILPATLPDAVIGSGIYSQQLNATGGGIGTGTGTFSFEPDSTATPTDRDWEGFSIVGKNLEMVTTRLMTPKTIRIKVKRISSGCEVIQSYTLGVVPKIAAPIQLNPMQINSNSFRARWEPVARAVKYRIYVATSNSFDGGSFAIGYIGLAVEGDTSILVQNLKPDTKYFIQITAISSAEEVSPYSNLKDATTLSAVTSIDNALSSQVKVSPNPSNDKFLVDFGTLNLGKTTARVYDAQGKQVFSSEINASLNANQSNISLGNMAKGIYLLEIISNKGRILKRLVKE